LTGFSFRSVEHSAKIKGIPGAEWKDPEKVAEWGKDLGSGEVVVYCVRGGSVSRSVQEKLQEKNVNVRFIEGGLEAWKRSGKPAKNL